MFYRRRSDKPLGPPKLQELVLQSRNPDQHETAGEETTEESDAGEGQLGGPNGSLLGSSSALTGAGVGRAALTNGAGGRVAGAGTQANSNQITRTNSHSIGMVNGQPVYGPQRPSQGQLKYGDQGTPWNWAGIDGADYGTEALTNSINMSDDDAKSTVAEADDSAETSLRDDIAIDPLLSSQSSGVGHNTPLGSEAGWASDYDDDQAKYMDGLRGRDDSGDALHLHDAGMTEAIGDEHPLTVDIHLTSPPPTFTEHDKMEQRC